MGKVIDIKEWKTRKVAELVAEDFEREKRANLVAQSDFEEAVRLSREGYFCIAERLYQEAQDKAEARRKEKNAKLLRGRNRNGNKKL